MRRCRGRSDFVRGAPPGGGNGRGQGDARASPRATPGAANPRRLLVIGRRQSEMKRDSPLARRFVYSRKIQFTIRIIMYGVQVFPVCRPSMRLTFGINLLLRVESKVKR